MTDPILGEVLEPSEVMKYVLDNAILFWRNHVDYPSAEEMRTLKDGGHKFGSGCFAYMRFGEDILSASTTIAESEPDETTKKTICQRVHLQLMNSIAAIWKEERRALDGGSGP